MLLLSIRTDLDVLQEKRLTIIVMSQTFVRFLKRIDKVHFIAKGISKRIFVVGVEIDKDLNDFQTRLCMYPEVWTKIGKTAQNRENR